MTDGAPPSQADTRPVHRPGANLHSIPLAALMLNPGSWIRMFQRDLDAIHFNRNSGNRFTPVDGRYSVLYVGDTTRTCFLEAFGDALYSSKNRLARSRWQSKAVATVNLPRLRVCDLTNDETLARIGLDKGAIYANDLSIPQLWAKAIMEHPLDFEGIRYSSRFGDGKCLALFNCPALINIVKEQSRFDLHGSKEGDALISEFNIALI